MTDIQALKKAAEAYLSIKGRFNANEIDDYAVVENALTDYRVALHDPATVLELCRLAEIGEAVERGEYIHRDAALEAEHEADEERT